MRQPIAKQTLRVSLNVCICRYSRCNAKLLINARKHEPFDLHTHSKREFSSNCTPSLFASFSPAVPPLFFPHIRSRDNHSFVCDAYIYIYRLAPEIVWLAWHKKEGCVQLYSIFLFFSSETAVEKFVRCKLLKFITTGNWLIVGEGGFIVVFWILRYVALFLRRIYII